MTDDVSVPTKVAASFQQLKAAATQLNLVSNELGTAISTLDTALQHLNLGISTWVKVDGSEDPENGEFWEHHLGYAKVAGAWGIALRTWEGNAFLDQVHSREEWLFNKAPRALRVKAVDKLPELLEQLTAEANSTAAQIRTKIESAQQVARAIAKPRPSGQQK